MAADVTKAKQPAAQRNNISLKENGFQKALDEYKEAQDLAKLWPMQPRHRMLGVEPMHVGGMTSITSSGMHDTGMTYTMCGINESVSMNAAQLRQ